MDQRLSLITLGVQDVGRAQAFYEAIGWRLGGGVDALSLAVSTDFPGRSTEKRKSSALLDESLNGDYP